MTGARIELQVWSGCQLHQEPMVSCCFGHFFRPHVFGNVAKTNDYYHLDDIVAETEMPNYGCSYMPPNTVCIIINYSSAHNTIVSVSGFDSSSEQHSSHQHKPAPTHLMITDATSSTTTSWTLDLQETIRLRCGTNSEVMFHAPTTAVRDTTVV